MNNFLSITIFTFMVLQNMAMAKEGGNGGISVVCRGPEEDIQSVQLLDLYEAEIIYKRKLENQHQEVDEIIEKALKKLKGHTQFTHSLREELAIVARILEPIPYGHELEKTNDAYPIIKKKGCKLEQLANYTNEGVLYFSQEIFDKLDNLNIAALYLHEAVYAIRRKFGDKTSQKTRKFVAHLMAENGSMDIINKLPQESVLFKTGSYISENQGCRIHITEENGLSMSISNGGNPMKCEATGKISLTPLEDEVWQLRAQHVNDSDRTLTYFLKFLDTHIFIISSHLGDARLGNGLIYRKEI